MKYVQVKYVQVKYCESDVGDNEANSKLSSGRI